MIHFEHVTKTYPLYTVPFNTLKSWLLNRQEYQTHRDATPKLHVIRDLTMSVREGEVLGIVGPNGVGKSTLAKLIAQTVQPTSGRVVTSGRIVPFLELGVAFSDELTGLDNMRLNGVLLGLSWRYLRSKQAAIFEHAGLTDFMHTPLKYYSSGMKLRLAFSVAMHAEGDIYLFDEILAVGDDAFRLKCIDAFHGLIKHGKTIVLITHDLGAIQQYAHRVLVLSKEHPPRCLENPQAWQGAASLSELYDGPPA